MLYAYTYRPCICVLELWDYTGRCPCKDALALIHWPRQHLLVHMARGSHRSSTYIYTCLASSPTQDHTYIYMPRAQSVKTKKRLCLASSSSCSRALCIPASSVSGRKSLNRAAQRVMRLILSRVLCFALVGASFWNMVPCIIPKSFFHFRCLHVGRLFRLIVAMHVHSQVRSACGEFSSKSAL